MASEGRLFCTRCYEFVEPRVVNPHVHGVSHFGVLLPKVWQAFGREEGES